MATLAWQPEDIALAIVTCPRSPSYLAQTLASLSMSDSWSSRLCEIVVAVDAPDLACAGGLRNVPSIRWSPRSANESERVSTMSLHRKASFNYWRALGAASPKARGLLVIEDDVIFRPEWLAHLLETLNEMHGDGLDGFILALYSPYEHHSVGRRGEFYSVYAAQGFYGTQAVFYTSDEAKFVRECVWHGSIEPGSQPYDFNVKDRALDRNNLYATRFSLVQHVGESSTGLGHFHTSESFSRPWPVVAPRATPIPKIIHQIWIGDKEFPERFRRYQASVSIPGWDYRMWTEGNLQDLIRHAACPEIVANRSLPVGYRSDVIRYEIMRAIGGIYLDVDFEILRPFDHLLSPGHAHFGYQRPGDPNNAFLASVPGNRLWEIILDDIRSRGAPNDVYDFDLSGPGALGRGIDSFCIPKESRPHVVNGQHVGEVLANSVVAFHPRHFYPYWLGEMTPEEFVPDRHPHAFAVHHWAMSWSSHHAPTHPS